MARVYCGYCPECCGSSVSFLAYFVPYVNEAIVTVEQSLNRALLIDMPNETFVGAKAGQLQESGRESCSRFQWNTQLLILLLTEISCAVIHCNPNSDLVFCCICTASVPCAPMPNQYRSFRHLSRNAFNVALISEIIWVLPAVTSGHYSRCSCFFGEVSQGPHRITDSCDMWFC